VKCQFKIDEEDDDFELSHEQLIKIMKIFLYKMSLVDKKSNIERGNIMKKMDERDQNN